MLKILFIICLLFESKSQDSDTRSDDIIILHTNDVHCGIQDQVGYDGLFLYKKQLQKMYKNVLTVDCGDHIQGGTLGLLTEGEGIIDIMNEVGFDAVTVGNHEFDYGVDQLLTLEKNLSCGYISSNIRYRKNKTSLFKGYKIINLNSTSKLTSPKIAFVGVATPQTLTKSSLVSIVDDDGKPTYDFLTENNGKELYEEVQKNINKARKEEKADYVIILAHLGKDGDATHEYTSGGLMENLYDVDAILDGHSHQIYSTTTPDKNKTNIILSQTGTKLATLGVLTIHSNGTLTHQLLNTVPIIDDSLNSSSYMKVKRGGNETYVDKDLNEFINIALKLLEEILSENIGYAPFTLNILEDPNDKGSKQLSRIGESTLCNAVADSIRAAGNADVTILNAGAVRVDLLKGNITYQNIIDIMPFSNDLEVKEVTGQTILDALEFGVKELPNPTSRFPQVSGISYKINTAIKTSIIMDENENFVKVGGKRRVFDVKVGKEPLDPEKKYKISLIKFISHGGDGYSMFTNYEVVKDAIGVDNEAFIEYIQNELAGTIPEKYRYPEGRITIVNSPSSESIRLISFGDYNNNVEDDVFQRAYFKRINTNEELKNWLKYTAKIKYDTKLRNLEETKTFNATGIKYKNESGYYVYNITYEGTKGLNIKNIELNNDFCFYDESEDENQCDNSIKVIGVENINPMDKNIIMLHSFEKDSNKELIENYSQSFNLNLQINGMDDYLECNNQKNISINYTNITNNEESTLICLLINKNNQKYQIKCKPKESISTYVNSMIIYNVSSKRKHRNLNGVETKHLYSLNIPDKDYIINFTYTNGTDDTDNSTDINKVRKIFRGSSKKGLTGGAIAAIVIASVVALVGIGIIFLIIKKPGRPIKNKVPESVNSTTSIVKK